MVDQKTLDKAYMECAYAIGRMSYAERKKVGAILVSPEDGIISEGFNGTPTGFENVCEFSEPGCVHDLYLDVATQKTRCFNCEDSWSMYSRESNKDREYKLVTKPEVLHAESNAITKVAKSTRSSRGATLYVTCQPCLECAKLIIQAGIVRVVFDEPYRLNDGIDLLNKAGINLKRYEIT